MTKEKIREYCKKYSEDSTTYGVGKCYYESICIENDELVSKLSTSGSYGTPYYVFGVKTRAQIEADLIKTFINLER